MKILIPQHVYDKVMHWVNSTKIEVSGFGKVVLDASTNTFTVVDAFLIEQEGGAAHTDLDAKALGKLMYQQRNTEGELRWWWHSHVDMAVFWSATDKDTIESLGKQGWIAATVFNKSYEYRSAVAYLTESDTFGADVTFIDEVDTDIHREIPVELTKQWDEEFARCVKEKQWPTTGLGASYYDGGSSLVHIPRSPSGSKFSEHHFYTHTDVGIFGYPVYIEALALGISVKQYLATLNYGSQFEVIELEDRLRRLEDKGELDKLWDDELGDKTHGT